MGFVELLKKRAKENIKTIVLPETEDMSCLLYTSHEIQEGIDPFIMEDKLAGYLINRSSSSISSYGKYGKYGYSKYGHYGKYKRYIKTTETSMNTEDTL